ncbi:MAG: site-specific DNA-methyltransferase [Pirellulales bacterium]|nr:site-specific DNA-methyltransferase [Pirellulales bacterium]MDA8042289.1 site-specific DNA-methyltransferase [Pirellulales bacterium]
MIYEDYRDIPADVLADMVILDTPWNSTNIDFDRAGFNLDDLARRIRTRLKPAGWLFMFGTLQMAALMLSHYEHKFDYIWKKPTGPALRKASVGPIKVHEMIYVYIQKELKVMSDLYVDRMALRTKGKPYNWRSTRTGSEYCKAYGHDTKVSRIDNPGYREGKSVLEFKNKVHMNPEERTTHPTQKPLDLIRLLIRAYCPPGGLVLDPTLGSGTTAEAAELENRRWVGAESDAKWRRVIAKRLGAA